MYESFLGSQMTLAFQKIRVYARVTLMGAVALLLVLVLVLNWNNRATVWFFHKFEDIPIIWLLLVTGFGGAGVAVALGSASSLPQAIAKSMTALNIAVRIRSDFLTVRPP